MARRQRRKVANTESSGMRSRQANVRKSAPKLPVEVLEKIIGYLKVSDYIYYERPPESAPALANAARVSRLFYELAMPLLWKEVQLWYSLDVRPYTLLKYPGTAERLAPYIRTMHISVGERGDNIDKAKLNKVWKFAVTCLQILTVTTSLKSFGLWIYMYNIHNHPREYASKLDAINNLVLCILRHAEMMELDEFSWNPNREASRSSDALRIIERKITNMRLCHLECGEWVNHLLNHERLTEIEVHNSRTEDSSEFNYKFWTAISQLSNCKKVTIGDIPIPFGWSIQFGNIIRLDLTLLSFLGLIEWMDTATAVFKYMPKLENLRLSSSHEADSPEPFEASVILDVACKNLKFLRLGGYSLGRLLVTIGNQCTNLTTCNFDLHNVHRGDLYALSQCRRIEHFALRYPNPIGNGLTYLTNLQRLVQLDLHYYFGRYMDTQLLLDFARFCPRLDTICVRDYNCNRRPSDPKGPFETEDISELFAAGAELHAYIEPRYRTPSEWTTKVLDAYLIRIDNLRRDKLSSQERN